MAVSCDHLAICARTRRSTASIRNVSPFWDDSSGGHMAALVATTVGRAEFATRITPISPMQYKPSWTSVA
jgi:hypothetical protein